MDLFLNLVLDQRQIPRTAHVHFLCLKHHLLITQKREASPAIDAEEVNRLIVLPTNRFDNFGQSTGGSALGQDTWASLVIEQREDLTSAGCIRQRRNVPAISKHMLEQGHLDHCC